MKRKNMLVAMMILMFTVQTLFAGSILVVDDNNYYSNETRLYAALDNEGIDYDTYDCSVSNLSPDSLMMSDYDLVIWFTGGDNYSLFFWNGTDSDNDEVKGYLNQGGRLWLFGVDVLKDRYGAAADTFSVGDFVYDYLGISSYDVRANDGVDTLGVPQLDQTTEVISTVDPIQWNVSALYYVDGVSLVDGAVSHYQMGPESYIYSGLSTVQSYTTEDFTVLSSFFKIWNFDTNDHRDTWVADVIDWFELPEDTLDVPVLLAPEDGSSYVMSTLDGVGLDLIWSDNGATSYEVYFEADGVLIDSIESLTDTTTYLDYAYLQSLMDTEDYVAIDWYVVGTVGSISAASTATSFVLSNQNQTILVVDDDNWQNYEFSLYQSLQRTHYAYDTYDASAEGGSPDAATLSAYDLVIWYTGNDNYNLYFWDGTGSDNPALISYLDGGGHLWINGIDVLKGRYGTAPDVFTPGDFTFDYMGILSYDVESLIDDDGIGAPLIARLANSSISAVDTVTWRFSTAHKIDGVTPNYRSFDDYAMGPAGYALAGKTNVCHYINENSIVLNSFFNFNHISDDSTRDLFTVGVMDWFETVATGNIPTASTLTAPAQDEILEIFVTDNADVEFVWDASTDIEGGVGYRFLLGESIVNIASLIANDQATPGYTINESDLYAMIPIGQDTLELFWQVLSYDEDHNFNESLVSSFVLVRDAGSGPSPFTLIEPHDGAMIRIHEDNATDIEFNWEVSEDPGGLTVDYTLNLMDEDSVIVLSVASADTSILVSSATLLTLFTDEPALDLTWSVVASNGDLETASMIESELTLVHALPQDISILVVDDDNRYNNETKVYTALTNNYYFYESYDCDAESAGPDSALLADYDLVIWFAGDDGVGLHFWNTDDSENTVIPQYLDAGGRMWVFGRDILYDRYGSAPDFFGPGDMIYDYFGTSSYLAQSWANDDNVGLEMLLKENSSEVTDIDTIRWGGSSHIHSYADGCALGEGAMLDLKFGPSTYQLADMANSYHTTDGNFITMSTWFNPYYMVSNADRADWVGDVVAWFENTMEPDILAAPILTAPTAGTPIILNSLADQLTFSWDPVSSPETVYYQLIVESDAFDVVPLVKSTTGTTLTLDGDDLFDLTGYGSDTLNLSWKVTAQTPMAAYSVSAIQSHDFIEGINEAPFAFDLLSPMADDTLHIDALDQSFTFAWTPSFDPEDDAINYQFILVGAGSDTLVNVNTADTTLSFSAADLIGYMGGSEAIVTFWKVFAQDDEFSTGADPRMLYLENHVVGVDDQVIPEAYALYQNYPNPFNPTTTIRYDLPEAADVSLTIYDITGRVVNQLQVGSQSAGSYTVQWQGSSRDGLKVSTGVYLCRIQTASYSKVIKMLYLK